MTVPRSPARPGPSLTLGMTKRLSRTDLLAVAAARVLADAIKRAGSTDGPKLRDAIAATKGFAGVTGTINLGPDRNPAGKDLVIVEVTNGDLALKARVTPTGTSAAATTGTTETTGSVPTTATTRTQ